MIDLSPEDALIQKEACRLLRQAIDERLSERQKEILESHFFEDEFYVDIAVRWRVSPARIYQLKQKGLRLLRKQITLLDMTLLDICPPPKLR